MGLTWWSIKPVTELQGLCGGILRLEPELQAEIVGARCPSAS